MKNSISKGLILGVVLLFNLTAFAQVFSDVKVVKILDGDTVDVLIDNVQTRIRIAEIDCPERGQPYSKKAQDFTKSFLYGNVVNLKVRNKDRYGRSVGYLSVKDKDLSAELVKNGYAWVYRHFSDNANLLKYEDKARAEKKGLWVEPNPIEPSVWRKNNKKHK